MKACAILVFLLLSVTAFQAQSAVQASDTPGQNQAPAASDGPIVSNLVVSSNHAWTDSNLDLRQGDVMQITADVKGACKPASLPVSTALPGPLIAKIGDGTPFLIGSQKTLNIDQPGHLFLGLNASGKPSCGGDIEVRLQLTTVPVGAQVKSKLRAAAQTWLSGQFGTGTPEIAPSPGISGPAPIASIPATPANTGMLKVSDTSLDSQLAKDLDGLPRRTTDQSKNLGDMINFVIIGSQQKLQAALGAAHWQLADQSTQVAVVSAILETYQNKDYRRMPMSILYLFNRPQDFGYEQAEAYSVVASRHHCRVWKAPFTWNGQTVWIGAGTHDIGFEKDQRNGKVTHKIDPAVDGERDHIGENLQQTGQMGTISYYLPPQPLRQGKNASGGCYHSDGRLLVMRLK
jgi:LssY-like putative type I secretion system component LssY